MNQPIPFRADPGATRRAAVASLARAAVGVARGIADKTRDAHGHVTRAWPRDEAAIAVAKAATSPADTEYASVLVRQIIPEFFAALGPASAGAQLLSSSMAVRFNGAGTISVPSITADPGLAAFIAEGTPMNVGQGAFAPAVLLRPHKLGVVLTLSREMAESSNAQVIFEDLLLRSTALALDLTLFSSSPGTAAAPAGLRSGVPALNASSDPDPLNAMFADIGALVAAVSPITAEPPTLIMNSARAVNAVLRAPHGLAPMRVLASAAVAANHVLVIAPIALASATGDAPRIEETRAATLHTEGAEPLAIIDGSGTLAVPTRSLWQTDSIGLRVIYPADWALRDSRGLAWLTATAW